MDSSFEYIPKENLFIIHTEQTLEFVTTSYQVGQVKFVWKLEGIFINNVKMNLNLEGIRKYLNSFQTKFSSGE